MRNVQASASMGAYRHQRKIFEVIANNLSNVPTAGFKKDVSFFHTLLSQSVDGFQSIPVDGIKTFFQQGNIQKTENDLDLAIEGEGFFKVKTPYGIRYTRAGNFGLNKNKVLVDANGFPVMGRNGEITLNGQPIHVEKDGTLNVGGKKTDQILLVTLPNLDLLKKEGHTLFYLEAPLGEIEVQGSQILQGSLESSNVNSIEEMVSLIESLRSYESCLKVIQSQDELDSKAANEIGRV